MTAIEAVGTFVPPDTVSMAESLRGLGFSAEKIRLYERIYGFSSARVDSAGGLADQLTAAGAALPALPGRRCRVRYVLHARTMPVVAPYPLNPLAQACEKLGLEHATAFSVSQHACASALLAFDIAGRLLDDDGDPDALALILAADKSFTTSAPGAVTWAGLMGESAAAVLVRRDGARDRMRGYATKTYGRFHRGPWMTEEEHAEFRDMYPAALAGVIGAAVADAGLGIGDIALILPHNVNRLSWTSALRLLGIADPGLLYLDNQARLGHCYAADSFIGYATALAAGRLRPGDHYVMTSVGLGATFSAMVFTH